MRFLHIRLVGPAIAGIALLIVGMAMIPYFGVARLDAEARQRQETLVERNIALWTGDIEFALTAWTIWDEPIAKIDNQFDFEWTDRNIGASLIGTSRTRFTAIIDRDDAVIYQRTDETVANRPFFNRGAAAVITHSASLIDDVRKRETEIVRGGIPDPISSSHIEILGDEAILLTASLFQPDFGIALPRQKRAPVLITAMPLDGGLEEFFGVRFLLDEPRVSPLSDVAPGRAHVAIAVGADGETQVLSWRPPTPAANVLQQSLPLIVTVGAALVAGGFLAIRLSQTTAAMLVSRERQSHHAAAHDFLTGLSNRSRLVDEFREKSAQGPFAIVCLDLDGFKRVNDTHGHAVGDTLLKIVADRLRSNTRPGDAVFRLGGDEFVVMMPAATAEIVEQACQRMMLSLSASVSAGGTLLNIGASFGVTIVAQVDMTLEAALAEADTALYTAKTLGRGRIVVAGSGETQPVGSRDAA